MVINLITGTKESLTSAPVYSTLLTNSISLYDDDIRNFINAIKSQPFADQDPFVKQIEFADSYNVTECDANVNANTSELCKSIELSNDQSISKNAQTFLSEYCPTSINTILEPKCMTYINENQSKVDINNINSKMLDYCISYKGRSDTETCKPFSKIINSSQWLSQKTKNNTIKDENGNVIDVEPVCGTDEGLELTKCMEVCDVYPEICEEDKVNKCKLPHYRYSGNIDRFNEKQKKKVTFKNVNDIKIINDDSDKLNKFNDDIEDIEDIKSSFNIFVLAMFMLIILSGILCFRKYRQICFQNKLTQTNNIQSKLYAQTI